MVVVVRRDAGGGGDEVEGAAAAGAFGFVESAILDGYWILVSRIRSGKDSTGSRSRCRRRFGRGIGLSVVLVVRLIRRRESRNVVEKTSESVGV